MSANEFTIVLSHDVDMFYPVHRLRLLRALIGNRDEFDSVLDAFRNPPNPYATLERITTLESRYDAASTFFLLQGRATTTSRIHRSGRVSKS